MISDTEGLSDRLTTALNVVTHLILPNTANRFLGKEAIQVNRHEEARADRKTRRQTKRMEIGHP